MKLKWPNGAETLGEVVRPLDDKLQNTMTKGIISAERIEQGLRMIQSDPLRPSPPRWGR